MSSEYRDGRNARFHCIWMVVVKPVFTVLWETVWKFEGPFRSSRPLNAQGVSVNIRYFTFSLTVRLSSLWMYATGDRPFRLLRTGTPQSGGMTCALPPAHPLPSTLLLYKFQLPLCSFALPLLYRYSGGLVTNQCSPTYRSQWQFNVVRWTYRTTFADYWLYSWASEGFFPGRGSREFSQNFF